MNAWGRAAFIAVEVVAMSLIEVLALVVLVLLMVGMLPAWPYAATWGYYPSGGALLVLVLLLVLLLARR